MLVAKKCLKDNNYVPQSSLLCSRGTVRFSEQMMSTTGNCTFSAAARKVFSICNWTELPKYPTLYTVKKSVLYPLSTFTLTVLFTFPVGLDAREAHKSVSIQRLFDTVTRSKTSKTVMIQPITLYLTLPNFMKHPVGMRKQKKWN